VPPESTQARAGRAHEEPDMNELIATAILEKRQLRFRYHGRERLVEPQCYGIGVNGTELLRARQLQGGDAREPLFELGKMQDLRLLDTTFARPGPNYRKDDSAMKTIFYQL
jgi:predicted DNA-binding transcriptional regulator YafY